MDDRAASVTGGQETSNVGRWVDGPPIKQLPRHKVADILIKTSLPKVRKTDLTYDPKLDLTIPTCIDLMWSTR